MCSYGFGARRIFFNSDSLGARGIFLRAVTVSAFFFFFFKKKLHFYALSAYRVSSLTLVDSAGSLSVFLHRDGASSFQSVH